MFATSTGCNMDKRYWVSGYVCLVTYMRDHTIYIRSFYVLWFGGYAFVWLISQNYVYKYEAYSNILTQLSRDTAHIDGETYQIGSESAIIVYNNRTIINSRFVDITLR